MPQKNSYSISPDPFVMNQDLINTFIENHLNERGFINVVHSAAGTDVDVFAEKNNWRIYVESRGTQARKHDIDTVFNNTQLRIHLAKQIEQIMRLQQKSDKNDLYIIGLADIPRMRKLVKEITRSLDKLEVIRFWVSESGKIVVDTPAHLKNNLKELYIIDEIKPSN